MIGGVSLNARPRFWRGWTWTAPPVPYFPKGLSTRGQHKAPKNVPENPGAAGESRDVQSSKGRKNIPQLSSGYDPTFQSPSKYPPTSPEKEKRSLNGLLAVSFGQKLDIYFSLRGTTLLFFSFLSLTKTNSWHLLSIWHANCFFGNKRVLTNYSIAIRAYREGFPYQRLLCGKPST